MEVLTAKMIASISRSAMLILSTSISKRLTPYFSASELILVLLALHTLMGTVKAVPGFNASWKTLRDLMQFILVHALTSYVSTGSDDYIILNLILLLASIECIPGKEESGDNMDNKDGDNGENENREDMRSFTTSVTYIFSDKISALLVNLNIPLFGAALSLCLGGQGALGRTLSFVGVSTLSSLVFEAISGGELTLVWPIIVLYFVLQINSKNSTDTTDSLFNFGLYKASDAIYSSLTKSLPPSTIFMAFLFLGSLQADPVWVGVCALVFVQGGSDWFMGQLGGVTVDPVLAGLSLVTAVHFVSIAIEFKNK